MKGKRVSAKTKKTSNTVLILLGVFLFMFIVSMVVVFCIYQSVPDTLIQCVLGTGGLEALILGGIKISKVMKGEKINTEEENNNGESC